MELVVPVGSAEGVSAAVESGADAVCVSISGSGSHSEYDITSEQFAKAAEFCRVRDVKIYLIIERAPKDDDFEFAVEAVRRASRSGVDAAILNDFGLIWAVRKMVPDLPVHAGVKLNIHNLDGVRLAEAMGVKRISLPPQMKLQEIVNIAAKTDVELEIQVHGRLCPAYQSHCLIPSYLAKPEDADELCRDKCVSMFPPRGTKRSAPFDNEDLCLADEMKTILTSGATALRIESRDRGPEYTAAVTRVYARLLRYSGRPTDNDIAVIKSVYPVTGFTNGSICGNRHGCVDSNTVYDQNALCLSIKRDYLNSEYKRVPVVFTGKLKKNEPFSLTVLDRNGHSATATGAIPELAFHLVADMGYLKTELSRTDGTPFECRGVQFNLDNGLYIAPAEVAKVLSKILSDLTEQRKPFIPRTDYKITMPERTQGSAEELPVLTVSIQKLSQLSDRLLELAPIVIYVPMSEILESDNDKILPCLNSATTTLCAVLPPFVTGNIDRELEELRRIGLREVIVSNIGHILPAKRMGFSVRGDFAMNIRNSADIHVLSALGLKSVTLSPTLSAEEVKAISKLIPAEQIIYGRLPLISTGECIIKNELGTCSCDSLTGLSDVSGFVYPITRTGDCRNTLWSAKKLFTAERSRSYMTAGLWGVRLLFSTEDDAECVAITERYLKLNSYTPASYMTSLLDYEE